MVEHPKIFQYEISKELLEKFLEIFSEQLLPKFRRNSSINFQNFKKKKLLEEIVMELLEDPPEELLEELPFLG